MAKNMWMLKHTNSLPDKTHHQSHTNRLRFFPKEPCSCPCKKAEIETRQHLLFNWGRFRNSWNPKRKSIFDILTFLEFNPGVFPFQDGIM